MNNLNQKDKKCAFSFSCATSEDKGEVRKYIKKEILWFYCQGDQIIQPHQF